MGRFWDGSTCSQTRAWRSFKLKGILGKITQSASFLRCTPTKGLVRVEEMNCLAFSTIREFHRRNFWFSQLLIVEGNGAGAEENASTGYLSDGYLNEEIVCSKYFFSKSRNFSSLTNRNTIGLVHKFVTLRNSFSCIQRIQTGFFVLLITDVLASSWVWLKNPPLSLITRKRLMDQSNRKQQIF